MNTNYFYLNIMISRDNNKKETGKKSLLYFTDISKALKALCKAEWNKTHQTNVLSS